MGDTGVSIDIGDNDATVPIQRPFLALFAARFSIMVFAGFFLVVFFCCIPFAISASCD